MICFFPSFLFIYLFYLFYLFPSRGTISFEKLEFLVCIYPPWCCFFQLKGTVRVILSDPPRKVAIARFTTVPYKLCLNNYELDGRL